MIAKGTLTFVGAATQTGKTLLFLYIACRMIQGGSLFDRFAISPVNRLLYLVLEDPKRRIKDRLKDMLHELKLDPNRFVVHTASGLKINEDSGFQYFEQLIRIGRRLKPRQSRSDAGFGRCCRFVAWSGPLVYDSRKSGRRVHVDLSLGIPLTIPLNL